MDALDGLRKIRKAKGLTLKELSRLTGLSAKYLGQVERGRANPSIATLKKITDGLDIRIMSLIENGSPEPLDGPLQEPAKVVRADQRKELVYPNKRRRSSLLTPNLQGNLEVIYTEEEPSPDEEGEWYSHQGEEFGLVLEGCYEVTVKDKVYLLEKGDTITYQSILPHRMRNPGHRPSKILWVITPPSF